MLRLFGPATVPSKSSSCAALRNDADCMANKFRSLQVSSGERIEIRSFSAKELSKRQVMRILTELAVAREITSGRLHSMLCTSRLAAYPTGSAARQPTWL